jgi:membrane-associated phospholipid phosphatase
MSNEGTPCETFRTQGVSGAVRRPEAFPAAARLRGVARRPDIPLLVALVCLLAMGLTGLLALGLPTAHERDAAMLHGFTALDRPRVHGLFVALASLADPLPYAMLGLAIAGLAVAQGRRWRAGAVIALLGVTGASTQLVKHLVAEPRVEAWLPVGQINEFAWPSGHATAAMTLALCAVLVAPPAVRAMTALGGGLFAAGVGYSVIVLAWHYPSDVLGGFLMAAMWTALAVAVLRVVEKQPASEPSPVAWGPQLRLWLAAAAAGVATVLVAAATRDGVAIYAAERPTLVLGAVAIVAVAAALAAGLARAA